jgi:methyltransferase
MSLFHIVLGLVVLQRLGELAVAARNTRDLRAAGAIELDAGGYPLFVLLHAAWLLSLALMVPASAAPSSWPLLAVFAALQLGRLWVIASLGRYWTTRIIVPPDRPPVSRGPYRFLRHPNYLIVVAEIAVLPLAFGAIGIATVFSAANLALLARRVVIEERALAPRRPVGAQSP